MPDSSAFELVYRRSVRTSFFLVLFLVLIGGVVRSTGAGLGCPDWPRCFGLWVPPTSIEEIPAEFWNHPLSSENGKVIFNPVKTWTEYLNRLLGVIIGFSILIQALLSFFQKKNRAVNWYSSLALVLVLFQGWLGARVVSSDLRPLVISLHLLVALLIGITLLLALFYSRESFSSGTSAFRKSSWQNRVLFFSSLFLLIQFFLGTEVRSQVDGLFREFDFSSRELYAGRLDWKFLIHRSFSLLTFALLFVQFRICSKQFEPQLIWVPALPLLLSVLLILSGVVLVYLGFPAFAQPFHLLFGFSVVCSECWLVLRLCFSKKAA